MAYRKRIVRKRAPRRGRRVIRRRVKRNNRRKAARPTVTYTCTEQVDSTDITMNLAPGTYVSNFQVNIMPRFMKIREEFNEWRVTKYSMEVLPKQAPYAWGGAGDNHALRTLKEPMQMVIFKDRHGTYGSNRLVTDFNEATSQPGAKRCSLLRGGRATCRPTILQTMYAGVDPIERGIACPWMPTYTTTGILETHYPDLYGFGIYFPGMDPFPAVTPYPGFTVVKKITYQLRGKRHNI